MARKFGLVPENKNFKKWVEITERTYKAGQAIHHANLQDQHNKLVEIEKNKSEAKDINTETSK